MLYRLTAKVEGHLLTEASHCFRVGEFLFEVIMRRYERKSTMMTSNRPLEDWGKIIGDVPAASAILDRLLHHAELIEITGESYRDPRRPKGGKKKGHRNGSEGEAA